FGSMLVVFFFFFQAEDGIRDPLVTGVQTCALPIYRRQRPGEPLFSAARRGARAPGHPGQQRRGRPERRPGCRTERRGVAARARRSEERRVGKEGRSRWRGDRDEKSKAASDRG